MTVVSGVVAEEQLSFCSLVHDDKHATVHHEVDIGAEDIHHLDTAVHLHVLRHMDKETVLS